MAEIEEFGERLRRHSEHIANVGTHCDSEETTKQVLVLPLLDILGFNPYDPLKVKAEYEADVPGVKRNERVDYALFSDGELVMLIEAKPYKENLTNHANQLARYFNAITSVYAAAITNGREWRFFTDLQNKNVMDNEPFLVVDFLSLKSSDVQELTKFRYGSLRPDTLRTVAEDLTYLRKFKAVLEKSLRQLDPEFVRFVLWSAVPNIRITQKMLESLTPLVKRAVAETMSGMLVDGLNQPTQKLEEQTLEEQADIDPENPNIVTTQDERRVAEIVRTLLRNQVGEDRLVPKDTESYFAVLYQGKVNRWLIRYDVNRKRPTIQFRMKLTESHKAEITRAGLELNTGDVIYLDSPDHLMYLPGLVLDALGYCRDDNNFKVKRSLVDEAGEIALNAT
jgi:hypothetical protein